MNKKVPEGWKFVQLGNVVTDIGDGGTPSRKKPSNFGGGIPWAVVNDVKFNITSTKESLSAIGLKSSSAKLWPPKTVILTTGASIGKVGLADFPLATKQGVTGIVCKKEKLEPEYLSRFFEFKERYLNRIAQGSTFKEVREPILRRIELLLPPLLEQRKIAAILSSVEEAIEKTKTVIEQTKVVKKGLMQELLTRGIPGRHKNFKKTPIGEIPEEWEVVQVRDACEILDKMRKPLSADERKTMKGEIPYWGPTGPIDYIDKYIFDDDSEIVLIGEDGDHFLKWRIWPMAFLIKGKCWVNNHAHILRGKNGCTNAWIWRFFQHRDIFPYLNISGSRTRMKLNQESLIKIPLPLPNEKEQKMITDVLENIEEQEVAEKNIFDNLQLIKTALMQIFLTGEVRVKV